MDFELINVFAISLIFIWSAWSVLTEKRKRVVDVLCYSAILVSTCAILVQYASGFYLVNPFVIMNLAIAVIVLRDILTE